MRHSTKHRGIRRLFLVSFSLYLIFLCYVLLFRASPAFVCTVLSGTPLAPRAVHLIPFETTCFYLFHYNKRLFVDNVPANYAVFMPLGFFFAGLRQRPERKWTILLIGAGISLGFELLQMWFHLGEFDVDDIMLNALGMWTGGFLLYRLQHCKWLVQIKERMMRK